MKGTGSITIVDHPEVQEGCEGDESSLDGALEAWSEQSNVFYQMGLVPIAYDEHGVFLLSPLR